MSTSAPLGHRTPTHRAERRREPSERFSPYVVWSWGLIAVTLPAGIVAVLLLQALAAVTDLGVGEATGAPDWVDYGFYLAVAAPLVASVVVGLRGWRREHEGLALRASVVSAGLLVFATALVLLSL